MLASFASLGIGFTRSTSCLLTTLLSFGLLAPARFAVAQDNTNVQTSVASQPSGEKAHFVGCLQCERCHDLAGGASTQPRDILLPDGTRRPRGQGGWIRENEYSIWAERDTTQYDKLDKHHQAYDVLKTKRADDMGKLLGTDVRRDRRCVACHCGYPVATNDSGLLSEEFVAQDDVRYGVTCEGCHGGAGEQAAPRRSWYSPHSLAPAPESHQGWRYLSSQTKLTRYGFTDVRSPVARATLCLSCHVGDADRGRILTHEMYAAGHPPLAGFEIETYADHMPKHWRPLSEKSKEIRNEYFEFSKDEIFKDDLKQPQPLIRTKGLVVGALMTLNANLKLTAALCAAKDTRVPWPEFSQFACFACHHDLKKDGWRLQRQPTKSPGRPPLPEWPYTLVRIAITSGEPKDAEIVQAIDDLASSVRKRPFGDKADLGSRAGALATRLEELAKRVQAEPMTREKAELLRAKLCDAAVSGKPLLDYDSARQVAWAFRIVDTELSGQHVRGSNDPVEVEFQKLDPAILVLNPKKRATAPPLAQSFRLNEVDLGYTLPPIQNYSPDEVQGAFGRIREALHPK